MHVIGVIAIFALGMVTKITVSKSSATLEKVTRAHETLARMFQQSSVPGRFMKRSVGLYSFVPANDDLPVVTVVNTEKIGTNAVGIPIVVRGKYEANKRVLNITSYKFALGAGLAKHERAFFNTANQPRIVSAGDTPMTSIDATIQAGDMGSNPAPKLLVVEKKIRSLRKKYRQALSDKNNQARSAAVRELADVLREFRYDPQVTHTLKAQYGELDNYPPWSYARIFQLSKSVVAIGEPGDNATNYFEPFCSGFMVAKDLVMTAGHCFSRHDPRDLEVWFGYVEDQAGSRPKPLRFAILGVVAPGPERLGKFQERAQVLDFDEDFLDLAIIKINTQSVVGNRNIPHDAKPQCLQGWNARKSVRKGRPIYVIGYPGYPESGRQKVHDAGRVYLPFRIRGIEFAELHEKVELDLIDLPDGQRIARVEEFLKSYEPQSNDQNPWLELRDKRYGGQPRFGVAIDAFKGNSGSPVYDRNHHCVVGVLVAGALGTGKRLTASWELHESVLPMSAIQRDLERYDSTKWLAQKDALKWR